MQNVDFKPSIHNADGQLLDTVKVPEYTADSDVFFDGSDSDIAFADAQDAAITDTFRNIVSDPEFNALSFKNGRQEVYVSPSTSGNGYRVSYTVDGVPTGHHDYSLDEIDDLSRNLREMAGNGGEDIRIQRKSDLLSQTAEAESVPNNSAEITQPNVNSQEPDVPKTPISSGVEENAGEITSDNVKNNDLLPTKFEGEELENAKAEYKKNRQTIKALKDEITVIEGNEKNYRNGKLLKSAQQEVNTRKAKIKELENTNKPLYRGINGKNAPIKESISEESYRGIFDKRNGFDADIGYASMFAGEEGKELAKQARKAMNKAVESGDPADIEDFYYQLMKLDEAAKRVNKPYVTKESPDGGWTYDSYFMDGSLVDNAGRTSGFAEAWNLAQNRSKAMAANTGANTPRITEAVGETTPGNEVPAPKPNEVPNVKPTEPKATNNEVPNVKSNKTTNKAQGGADVGNVPPSEVGKAGDIGNSPHTKTSEAYTNTGKRGGGWNKAEYSQYTDESKFQYEDQTERESIDKAINMIKKEGLDGFKDRVMGKERLSASEVDGLMMEWRILCKQARDIEAAGGNATKAWEESVKVFRKIQEQASNNAQALQAMAKWSRNTPEGMLAQAENILNGRTKVKKSAAQKVLDRFQKEHKGFKFSDEFVAHFLKEADKLKDLDPDSMEYKTAMADLGRQVNAQLPSKFSEKLTTLLMDNMLGNFRTLITRNAGGNIGLNAVEQLLQRPLAALIDMGLAKKTGKRTQVGLTKDGIVNYLKGFGKGLKEEAIDFKNNLHTSRSGEVTFEDAIAKNRHVFKEGGLLDRFYDKLIKHGLSVGDRPFYEAVYKQTLGDYQRLRERGQMGEFIQGLSDEEFNMYAEAAAKMNALAAVYQQDSTLASALLGFKNSIGDLSRGLVGVDVLSQFSMPFVKTPANVIERAIDYSPLGIIRNIARTRGEIKNDNFDQNRFANETSRNILGTAMMAGGAALANAGGMGGAFSEDKDEKKAQKDAGMIEYGMNVPDWVPALGGMQMDIGWVPVVGSNMVASAAATDAFKNGEGNALGNVAKGLLAGGKAQLDQSMFQGMQRLFGGSGSYDSDKNLFANMTDVFSSGLGQFVPSLLRQIGQVSDEYQRDLSNSNPDASFLFMDNYDLNSLANNLPVLRNLALAPKVDSQGELLEENQGRNVGMKILEDMILPGKISKVEFSALNNEANLIKDATNLSDAYMPTATRSLVDTDEHTLTNKEWADFEQKYYQEMTDIGTQIIKSDFYKESDYTEKNRLLKQAYDGIKSGASNEYNGKEVSGAAKAYVEAGGGDAGVKAVFDYVEKGAIANQVAEQTGYSSNSTAAKDIADDIIAGNTADATEAIEYAQSNIKPYVEPAKELGIEPVEYNYVKTYAGKSWSKVEPELPKLKELGGTNYSQYAHAVNYADSHGESISAQQFYDQTKRLDTDHSGGVSQDELINEFNAKGMKEAEVMRLWGMLALGKDGAETKSVPYIITRGKNKDKWGIKNKGEE